MAIPPISAETRTDLERSCNTRCCICIFPKRGTPKVTPQDELNRQISMMARDRLDYIMEESLKFRK